MSKYSDERIDQVLSALRDAEPPTGMEARIFSRTARAAEGRAVDTSRLAAVLKLGKENRAAFAGAPFYTLAGAALVLLVLVFSIAHVSHRSLQPVAQARPLATMPEAYAHAAQTLLMPVKTLARTRRNLRLTVASASPASSAVPFDPDAIALAETVAPSHPAPPLPLTPQERLMLSATQEGAPILLAELEPARELAIRASTQASEKAGLQQFARDLLAPLALSASLSPTLQDDRQTTPAGTRSIPAPEPSSSSLNQQPMNGASQ